VKPLDQKSEDCLKEDATAFAQNEKEISKLVQQSREPENIGKKDEQGNRCNRSCWNAVCDR
jgi:hypothetical protein